MNGRVKSLLISLFMVWGLAAIYVQAAAAYQEGGNLPTYKEPASARFDIKGSLSLAAGAEVGNIDTQITGSGAIANGNLQEDITVNLPALSGTGSPTSATSSVILIDKMYYFKVSGAGSGTPDTWFVVDLNKAAGAGGSLPGMGGSNLTGFDPRYAAAMRATQLGKESINGAPTTKYQIDMDLQKLMELMGSTSSDPQTAQVLNNAKMVVYMWIGDDDQYVHQTRAMLDLKVSVPTNSDVAQSISLAMDMLITYKDFGAPITITAPANAQPLDVGTSGSTSTVNTLFLGMPTSLLGGMTTQMPTGMPTTGAGQEDLPLVPLALAVLCLSSGALLRKRCALVR